jgi:hypothetical protein
MPLDDKQNRSGKAVSLDFITMTAPSECRVSLILQKTKTRTKGAAMKIIGCDFHPSFQQIAMVDLQTGEYTERRLTPEEARQLYAELGRCWWAWRPAATPCGSNAC